MDEGIQEQIKAEALLRGALGEDKAVQASRETRNTGTQDFLIQEIEMELQQQKEKERQQKLQREKEQQQNRELERQPQKKEWLNQLQTVLNSEPQYAGSSRIATWKTKPRLTVEKILEKSGLTEEDLQSSQLEFKTGVCDDT